MATRISKAQAGRMIDRSARTLRNWVAQGLVPPVLHFEDLPRLRELAGYTAKRTPAIQTDQKPGQANRKDLEGDPR
jgi:hypothetical protein